MMKADTLQITPEILGLIAGIDEFKGAWRALGTLAPDRLSALRRVATIESIGSSTRIEGSRLSDREVERLLSNLQIKSFATRDEQEVAGYAEVMDMVFTSWADIALTENHIRQLHRDLLSPQREGRPAPRQLQDRAQQRGRLRRERRAARRRLRDRHAVRHAAPDDGTGGLVQSRSAPDGAAASAAADRHLCVVVFLEIHPFQDGNGRLSPRADHAAAAAGRLCLRALQLARKRDRAEQGGVLPALRQTQGTIRTEAPDWQPWLLFFLRALAEQVRRLERKIEREKRVLAALPALSLQIVEFAREHGRITMGDAIRLTGGNRNTLKQHFRALVERGTFDRGGGRGAWYELR